MGCWGGGGRDGGGEGRGGFVVESRRDVVKDWWMQGCAVVL